MFSDCAQLDQAVMEKLKIVAQKLHDYTPRKMQGFVNEVMSGAIFDKAMVEHDHSKVLPRVTSAHLQESLVYLALKQHDGPVERLDYVKQSLSFHCELTENAYHKLEEVVQRTMGQSIEYLDRVVNKIVHNNQTQKTIAHRKAKANEAPEKVFVTIDDLENAYCGIDYQLPEMTEEEEKA